MQNIVKESLTRNGNGAGAINARGIPHRGWTLRQRIAVAADAVLGAAHVIPSIGQAATAFYVSPAAITAELQARAAAERQATTETEVAITTVSANGTTDLPTPPPSPSNDSMSFTAKCIVYSWTNAGLADQVTAIRAIGTDEVWNALVAAVSNQ